MKRYTPSTLILALTLCAMGSVACDAELRSQSFSSPAATGVDATPDLKDS